MSVIQYYVATVSRNEGIEFIWSIWTYQKTGSLLRVIVIIGYWMLKRFEKYWNGVYRSHFLSS